MANHSGGTAQMTHFQHPQPQHGYPQTPAQQQHRPPRYRNAPSYEDLISSLASRNNLPTSNNMRSTLRSQPDLPPPYSKLPVPPPTTQARAFARVMPCKPMRLYQADVLDRNTSTPLLAIAKEAVHLPPFLSSKPLLTITRCSTNSQLGTIRFHSMTTSDIELDINGRKTVLSGSRLYRRWAFQPTSAAPQSKTSTWYWNPDILLSRCIVLVDGSKTLARVDGSILSFEKAGLSDETLDEIVMTAVALAEHARRRNKDADVLSLSNSIVDFFVPVRRPKPKKPNRRRAHHGGYSGGVYRLTG